MKEFLYGVFVVMVGSFFGTMLGASVLFWISNWK